MTTAFDELRLRADAESGHGKDLPAYLAELEPAVADEDDDEGFFRLLDRAIVKQEREKGS